MDNSKIELRYNKALELKDREQYVMIVKGELTKPEWRKKLSVISSKMDSVVSESDYENGMKELVALFNSIYEKIAASCLDKFINWVDDNTKNNSNSKKLRAFLLKDYEKYSSKIDEILAAVKALPDENEKHLFDDLISSFFFKAKINYF